VTAPGATGSPKSVTVAQQSPTSGGQIQPVVISPQQIGAEFNVDITVTNVQNLYGISFVLNYDTNVLDVVTPTSTSVVAGPFMGTNIIFFPNVDEAGGKVSFGMTRTGNQSGVNGSGVVASVKFKSLAGTSSGTAVEFSLSNVAANDPAGNPIALADSKATLTLNAGPIVWPGDTDNNGVVNQADVLPLGLSFGQTGPPRQNASLAWVGQSAAPWSNIKYTYADANGDGSVNQADVLPIGINFGKTHTTAAEQHLAKNNSLANAATLKPDVNPPQQAPGTEFFIKIRASEVADLFGASFELIYDRPSLVQILAVEPDSMLGSDVIFFSNVDAAGGKASVGITKKSGQAGANGTGSVVRLKAMLTAQAKNGDIINLSLQNVLANNSAAQAIEMTPQSSQIVVMTTAVASKHDTRMITEYRLYQNHPNPFNPSTLIQYEIPKVDPVVVKVYNSVGQEMRTLVNDIQSSGTYQINWDGRDEQGQIAPSGIYFYRFQAGSFIETRKMILLR
jgi:Cohesin domain/FlgD Ig-like domain